MKMNFIYCFLLNSLIIKFIYCFESNSVKTIDENDLKVKCETVEILSDTNDLIPSEFKFKASCGSHKFNFNFKKSQRYSKYVIEDVGIYMNDDKAKEIFYNDYEHSATALLKQNNPDQYIVSILTDDIEMNISPISESEYELNILKIKKTENIIMYNEINEDNNKNKRQIQKLNVFEVLLILDSTVYNKYSAIYNNLSNYEVIKNMFFIYAHMINQVDIKFKNSFQNDPSLNVNIKLTHILIYPNEIDTPWIDNTLVGVANATLNDIDGTKSLPILTTTMNSRKFPFIYDLAVAMTRKDIWLNFINLYTGYTYFGEICGSNRYSIVEDIGFNGIYPLAHHIGYILGSNNDGFLSSCLASSNNIMTPNFGLYNNFTNINYFSNCSINAFKNKLLPFKNNNTCVFSSSKIYDSSLTVDKRMPGNIWNLDNQCKFKYGRNSSYSRCFIPNDPICETLYCYYYNSCNGVKGFGAIDGTPCGVNKICLQSACVASNVTYNN